MPSAFNPGEVVAAKVEIALSRARIFDFYGAWREVKTQDQEPETAEAETETEQCAGCGVQHPRWQTVVMPRERWLQIAADDWKPRLSRTGSDPPQRFNVELPQHERMPETVLEEAVLAAAPRWHQRFQRWQAAAADAEQRARTAAGFTGEQAA